MTSGFDVNLAIFDALGIDPHRIRPNATIRFDKELGPVLTAEWILHRDGKPFTEDGENLAVELRRYKLVPLDALAEQG